MYIMLPFFFSLCKKTAKRNMKIIYPSIHSTFFSFLCSLRGAVPFFRGVLDVGNGRVRGWKGAEILR